MSKNSHRDSVNPSMMGLFVSKLTGPFIKDKSVETNYTKEIQERLSDFYHLFYHYIESCRKNRAYIVHTRADVQKLIAINHAATDSNVGRSIMNDFIRFSSSGSVLFVWNKNDFEHIAVPFTNKSEVKAIINQKTEVYDMSVIEKDPLYQASMDLEKLYDEAQRCVWENKTSTFLERISTNQDIVDYILKLEVIGKNPPVFEAMLRRDKDWLRTFYQPLAELVRQRELDKSGRHNRLMDYADIQLDQITSWSTPKIQSIDEIRKNEPIKLDQKDLFNDDFFKLNPVTSNETVVLSQEQLQDQANLEKLLQK